MSINSINTRINAIEGLIDEISEQLDYIRTEINRLEPPSPDTPEEPSPTPTQPSTGDGPHVLTLGPKGFTYEFEVPARSFALHVKRTSVALLQKTRSISKGQYVSIDGSWADYLGHGDILVGFDIGDGRWAGASVYKSNGKVRWREYNPNMVGVLFDDEYEMEGGTLSPSNPPVVIPDPPPVITPIKKTRLPKGYFSNKIVLFQENRGRSDYGIPGAVSMHRPEKGGGGNWCIAIWHPWYEPQHGTSNPQWVKASASQRLTWLKQNVDAAKRGGFLGWGCDWEGGLNMGDGLGLMIQASQYARNLGLAVMHIPKLGWEHQLGAYKVSQDQMDRFAIDNMDAICFWSPSATADQYTRDAQRIWSKGFGGDIVGLAYAGKGVSEEEDKKIIRQCRGIFNPGNSVAYPLVQYARSIQR